MEKVLTSPKPASKDLERFEELCSAYGHGAQAELVRRSKNSRTSIYKAFKDPENFPFGDAKEIRVRAFAILEEMLAEKHVTIANTLDSLEVAQ